MPSLQALPQEIFEEILTLLIWALPVSKSINLRSVNRRFQHNYDYLLFKQKRLLSQTMTDVSDPAPIQYDLEQHFYNLQGVIPISFATKLIDREWYNDDVVSQDIRLLVEQLERRIIGFCSSNSDHDLHVVRNDIRRVITLRLTMPDGLFRIGYRVADYAAKLLTLSRDLKQIRDVLMDKSTLPQFTPYQNLILDREASALSAAVSDPKYMKAAIKSGKKPASSLVTWPSEQGYGWFQTEPLEIAAMCGHVDNLTWLLSRVKSVPGKISPNTDLDRALASVALTGEIKAADVIMKYYRKCKLTASRHMLETVAPFQRACANSHLEVAKILEPLFPGSEDDPIRMHCIDDAMRRSCIRGAKASIIHYLVELGASVKPRKTERSNYPQQGPLMHAVKFGHKHLVRLLLDMGCDPHDLSTSHACYWPVLWGDVELLQILVNAGLDLYKEFPINRDSRQRDAILPTACYLGQIEVVKFMLKTYPEIIDSQHAPVGLEYAVEAGRRDIIELLVDKGAVSDASKGSYALFLAVKAADVHVVRDLIKAGVDLNRTFKQFSTDPALPNRYKLMTALAVAKRHAMIPDPKRVKYVKIYGLLRAAGAACRGSRWMRILGCGRPSPEPELMDED